MENNQYVEWFEGAYAEAVTALRELAGETREMIAHNLNGNEDDIRRNCETICAGLRDLAAALRDL